jgi:hypothetical protein
MIYAVCSTTIPHMKTFQVRRADGIAMGAVTSRAYDRLDGLARLAVSRSRIDAPLAALATGLVVAPSFRRVFLGPGIVR